LTKSAHAVAARIVGRAVAVDVVARIDAKLHLQADAAQDFLVDERGCAASAQQLRAQCRDARASIRILEM
jgi:hypothetical protein